MRPTRPAARPRQLPARQLSVSTLVELGRDPDGVAQRLRRRLPTRPDPHALLGTAFHDWVQRFFHAERLFDLDDLPGAVDRDAGDAEDLAELQAAFAVSPWAARTPIDVEVRSTWSSAGAWSGGVSTRSSPTTTAAPRWWTGRPANPPDTPEAKQYAAIQLAVYRLAWAQLHGCPVESVRAAFHYVRSGRTVSPESLPGADDLVALLDAA